MTPAQRDRYSRQVRLADIGEAGQERLLNARALVIGLGGLGSPAAMYLAASGVGTLVLSDYDRVEPSNLQRQIIHREADIGELKAASAQRTLTGINHECIVETIDWELDDAELTDEIGAADIVLDCTDNFATRFQLNRIAMAQGTPLVSGAAIRLEGQIMTSLPPGGPCYQCVYPDDLEHQETCAMEGVLAPLVGVIGSLQALQAVRVLTGHADELRGVLMLFDAAGMEWQRIRVPPRRNCPICGGH
ncbi:MAG: HesA/MoeB/ThiF family protein [Gammaproteobacteria bacterium]|nr:HesA/MoeB/ThiF family protein [Gammaproteobacteria bacterium]MCP5440366.1 HesA/MoeB/ThiF family protein [Chromatiaceae bacterium]